VLLAVEISGPDLKFDHRDDTFSDQIESRSRPLTIKASWPTRSCRDST
jgi:hypothetical protein